MYSIPASPTTVAEVESDHRTPDEELVNAWRVEQISRLGVPRAVAELFAAVVDRHELAGLVARGRPPEPALEIVRRPLAGSAADGPAPPGRGAAAVRATLATAS